MNVKVMYVGPQELHGEDARRNSIGDVLAELQDGVTVSVLVAADYWPPAVTAPWVAYQSPRGGWAYCLRHDPDARYLPNDAERRVPLLTPDAATTRQRLAAWWTATGAPWVGTPGTSGTAILRALWPQNAAGGAPAPTWTIDPSCGAHSGGWHRPHELDDKATEYHAPLPPRREATWLHGYDANAAYLGAAGNVEVAKHRLHPRRPAEITPNVRGDYPPGLYMVELEPWHFPIPMPHPAGPAAKMGGPVVLSHVTLRLLNTLNERNLYGGFRIIGANVCDKPARIFRKWAERLRDVMYPQNGELATAEGAALAASAKGAYREAIGLLSREGGRIYRPDWQAAIIAQSRVTMWRRAEEIGNRTGEWPVAIHVDELRYRSEIEDPVKAAPYGLPMAPNRLGGFKPSRSRLIESRAK